MHPVRRLCFSFALFAALLGCAGPAHARPRRVVVVERSYTHVAYGGGHWWYRDGYYYRRHAHRYVLVPAPRGAVVTFVPTAAVRLRFGAVHYRYWQGVYYEVVPGGYRVVERPATVYVERDAAAPDTVFVEPESHVVTVHNDNGSETPVLLTRQDGKWKGPKGELYDAVPTEDQLKPVYGI